ncbi:MAG: hypothetical protein ABIR91_05305 [Candidatus Saccharimonadales bacterium]
MTLSFATAVDKQIDDGNIHCGKIRYDTYDKTFMYGLAFDQKYF